MKGPTVDDIISRMPKVELHAHLNGSIGEELLNHLKWLGENDSGSNSDKYPDIESRGVLMEPRGLDGQNNQKFHSSSSISKEKSLEECWKSFSKIHQVIQTPRILYAATVNVIAEFSRDNVVYLELRTSPKKIHGFDSKELYLESVLKGIQDVQKKFPIIVKLLISVDRKNGKEEGLEAVELATVFARRYPGIVVGLDVSGDPNLGDTSWILQVMQEARNQGLQISCHLPEIVNPEECMAFMAFGPERVGHGQFLHPAYGGTEELWKLAQEKGIPVETCISSNLVSGVAASLDEHVVKYLLQESVPLVICTDDFGVFNTSLSNEFKKFASLVQIKAKKLKELCLSAVSYSFATDAEKAKLSNQIQLWWSNEVIPE